MDKLQIQNEIYRVKGEINNLNSSKTIYQNMNSKINDALKQLNKAKECMNEAKKFFDKNYSSETSVKQSKKIQNAIDLINEIYSELNDKILSASINKVESINNSITKKTTEKRQLNNKLKSL